MIRLVRDFRLIPVVLVATICLFALKTFGLVFNGGYTFNELAVRAGDNVDITGTVAAPKRAEAILADEPDPATPARRAPKESPKESPKQATKPAPNKSWAQQMFNFPDITGAVGEAKPPAPAAKGDKPEAKPQEPPPAPVAASAPAAAPSRAERAILERLQERRMELDARARDLEMRESLLKAAEKRLDGRLLELKDTEARINAALAQKDEAEAMRFKNLITMYDNMKAKEAAKIFDRLDTKVLLEVATQLNPRRMSDILAQMAPEAAERLTIELATRTKEKGQPPDLPKIEGRPMTN